MIFKWTNSQPRSQPCLYVSKVDIVIIELHCDVYSSIENVRIFILPFIVNDLAAWKDISRLVSHDLDAISLEICQGMRVANDLGVDVIPPVWFSRSVEEVGNQKFLEYETCRDGPCHSLMGRPRLCEPTNGPAKSKLSAVIMLTDRPLLDRVP